MARFTIAAKRKLLQICAFGFTNARPQNLLTGRLYQGAWKNFCAPGLNCYSCPAATLSCPIGALQAVLGDRRFNMSFYVVGLLLAFGVLLGRAVCGFLCPFGLLQELLYKIPLPKIKLPRPLRFVKYGVLAVFVVLMPVFVTNALGMGDPAFCKYICPAGTLEGGILALLLTPAIRSAAGPLFAQKLSILVLCSAGCIIVYRCFCKVLCPLGAIYGLLNKVSLVRLEYDPDACIRCGACAKACLMDVDPVRCQDHTECIRCGACIAACPAGALKLTFAGKVPLIKGSDVVPDAAEKSL